jgi:hypothetical protein
MKENWINEDMVSFTIEMIVHNSNLKTTVYYTQIFT